jgi:hypothetical protein
MNHEGRTDKMFYWKNIVVRFSHSAKIWFDCSNIGTHVKIRWNVLLEKHCREIFDFAKFGLTARTTELTDKTDGMCYWKTL